LNDHSKAFQNLGSALAQNPKNS